MVFVLICVSIGCTDHAPSAFAGSPFATSPFSLRSMYQLSVCPSLFFSVNAKTALPFLTASFRSAASDWREELIASKAAEEGKTSCQNGQKRFDDGDFGNLPDLRDIIWIRADNELDVTFEGRWCSQRSMQIGLQGSGDDNGGLGRRGM